MGNEASPVVSSSSEWSRSAALWDRLLEDSHEFTFFQAVRLLRLASRRGLTIDGQRLAPDGLRFRSQPSLSFPAAPLHDIEVRAWPHGAEVHLTVNFMGLTGPMGVLPAAYSVALEGLEPSFGADRAPADTRPPVVSDGSAPPSRRVDQDDVRAFLDLFTHRLVDLFWQAWRAAQPHLAREENEEDPLLDQMLAVAGLATGSDTRSVAECHAIAGFAGLLSRRTISAQTVAQALSGWSSADVTVTPLVESWEPLELRWQTRLGQRNCALGGEFVLGDRYCDRSRRLRAHIGPLEPAQFAALLPQTERHRLLRRLTADLLGPHHDVEVCLLLAADDPEASSPAMPFALGSACARLGLTTWIEAGPVDRTRADTRMLWTWRSAEEMHAYQP